MSDYKDLKAKPIKPLTAFFIYFKEQSALMTEKSTIERGKILGQKWKELSDKERKHYFDIYKRNMREYNTNLAKWYAAHPEDKIADEEKAMNAKHRGKTKQDKTREKEIAIFFAIGHMRKYIMLTGEPLEYNEKLAKILKSRFYMLSDADKHVWEKFWSKLDPEKQEEIANAYKLWKGKKSSAK